MHAVNILFEVSLAIVLATALAILAKALRQPVILGYVAAGVLAGPAQGFGWITPEAIEPVSELGLILLLFMIGLEIDRFQVANELYSAGATFVYMPRFHASHDLAEVVAHCLTGEVREWRQKAIHDLAARKEVIP